MSATEELYRSYLDLRWNFDPAGASASGITAADGRLAAFDPDSMRVHLVAFKSIASAAEQLEIDDTQEEIDRTAFLDDIRITVLRFEREKPHIHDPGFWLGHLFQALHSLLRRREGPLVPRGQGMLERLKATPVFLQSARDTLKHPPRVFIDTAAAMTDGGPALVAEAAGRAREWAPDLVDQIGVAEAEAVAALRGFGHALRNDLSANPDDLSFAIGEEQFNKRLHHEHALMAGAPELYRYGLHLVDEVAAELAQLGKQIDPSVPWRKLVERLRSQAAPGPDLVGVFREATERARRFVAERDLVRIPPGDLAVIETPGFMRPLIPFAAYESPGVFAEDRRGMFYVTSPTNGRSGGQQQCLHEVAATAVHEAYPGHHLQMLTAQEQQSTIRRILWTPVTVEGWALYCEELMAEQGCFSSVEERFFQRLHLLWRATRIVLDVGLHTRGLSPDEATDYLVDTLAMDRGRAALEVSRYCAWPTYQLCYAIGRREILHLRDAYRERAGSNFRLREFHDEFLTYGGLPVSLIRWGMGLGIDE
jgi:hypothetical protein